MKYDPTPNVPKSLLFDSGCSAIPNGSFLLILNNLRFCLRSPAKQKSWVWGRTCFPVTQYTLCGLEHSCWNHRDRDRPQVHHKERSQACCKPPDLCSGRRMENRTHTSGVEWTHQELWHPEQEGKGGPLTLAQGRVTIHLLNPGPGRQQAPLLSSPSTGHIHTNRHPLLSSPSTGNIHTVPSVLIPVGAHGLVQGNTGLGGWVPGTVGVPCQHAVLTATVLSAEGQGSLDHSRVGTSIDKPLTLCVGDKQQV